MSILTANSTLYVAWQEPATRRYYVVGRLHSHTIFGNHEYEFVYTKGALQARQVGFQSFLGFPQFEQVYRDRELFPLFANRVMPRSRPDYEDHVQRLGLTADTAHEMSELGRSGGMRATDTLEVFPCPEKDPESGQYVNYFMVHGIRHLAAKQQERILALKPGELLVHEQEPQNPADANAVRLLSADGMPVGYMPRYLAGDVCHLLEQCVSFEVYVERVNEPPAPAQQRLLCRLITCWPEGFQPCAATEFQPIPKEAMPLVADDAP